MWTFANKVLSLLFNTLSRLVIAFLQKSKYLSILWLQSPSTVILEPKKIKSVTVSIVSPSLCHEVMGPDATILVFRMLSIFQYKTKSLKKNQTLACVHTDSAPAFLKPCGGLLRVEEGEGWNWRE